MKTLETNRKSNQQFKNRSGLSDLFMKSVGLPYQPNLSEIPEVKRNLEIIKDLKGKLETCKDGGCGLFTIKLQNLIGGDIYELFYMTNQNHCFGGMGHIFLYKNGYCYDSYGACSMTVLQIRKRIKRVYTVSSMKYLPHKEQYVLTKQSENEILRGYREGDFFGSFSKDDMKELEVNYKRCQSKIESNE